MRIIYAYLECVHIYNFANTDPAKHSLQYAKKTESLIYYAGMLTQNYGFKYIFFFNWGHFKTLQLIVDAQTYFTVCTWQDTSILDQI